MNPKGKPLNAYAQATKLTEVARLVDEAVRRGDVVSRVGASMLCAGVVDYCAIMSARMLEQIVLKAALAATGKTPFQPHGDDWFYSKKVPTRRILKEIRCHLPFRAQHPADADAAEAVSQAANRMIQLGLTFLATRDLIVHHIGNPDRDLEDILSLCDQSLSTFGKLRDAYSQFVTKANPFRLTQKQYMQLQKGGSHGHSAGQP